MTMSRAPATKSELFRLLDALGIAHETRAHAPLFTVEQAKSVLAALPGARTKNLFLADRRGTLLLVSALEDTAIDLKALARHLSVSRLSFGSAETLRDALGVEPGSVTPFALMNDHANRVRALLDRRLFREPLVNFHPLSNDASTVLAPSGLVTFLAHVGHEPLVISFSDIAQKV
jgi:Ala-tRNA(Pro) deacylase